MSLLEGKSEQSLGAPNSPSSPSTSSLKAPCDLYPRTQAHSGLSDLVLIALSLSLSTPAPLLALSLQVNCSRPLHLLSFYLECSSLDPSDLYTKVTFSVRLSVATPTLQSNSPATIIHKPLPCFIFSS